MRDTFWKNTNAKDRTQWQNTRLVYTKPRLRFPAPQKGKEQKAPNSFQAWLDHCQHPCAMEVHFFTAVTIFSPAEGIWCSDEVFDEALFGLFGWLIMRCLFSYFWVWRIFLYSEYSSFIRCIIWQYFSWCATYLFFPSIRVGDGTQGFVDAGQVSVGPVSCISSPFHSFNTIIWKYFFVLMESYLFIYLFILAFMNCTFDFHLRDLHQSKAHINFSPIFMVDSLRLYI